VYELIVFIVLSLVFESGLGIVYGVGIGYEPYVVFLAAITLNLITIVVAIFTVDKLFEWKKGLKEWVEKRTGRARKLIDKYGCVGIVMGILILSPMQLAVVGRLIGVKSSRLYPSLLAATFLVALVYLGVSIGIFKFLLA
jgi:uncharacterized membrane protein